MATISLDVYYLIFRLNRTEKAYFTKFGYKYEKGVKPEKSLFEIIEKKIKTLQNINENIEDEILKMFSKKHPTATFSKAKTNLYFDLLSALRLYEKNKVNNEKVFELYQFAQILMKKNMFKEAYTLINRAEKLADENEFYELQILILQLKAFVSSRLNNSKNGQESLEQLNLGLNFSNKLEEILKLQKQFFSLAFMQKEVGTIKENDEILKLKQEQAHLSELTTASVRSEMYKLESLSTFAILFGNEAQSFENYKNIIELLDKNPSVKKNNLFKYIVISEQYLQMVLLSLNIEIFEEKFKHFKKIDTNNEQEQSWKENAEIFLLSISSILTSKLDMFTSLELRFNELLSKSDFLIPGYRKISIAYYMVSGFFMKDDFEKVCIWYNYINNNRNLGVRYDIDLSTRIMYIISLVSIKDYEFAENNFKNLKNFYDKNNKFKLDQIVISVLGKFINESDGQKLLEKFKDFGSKIETLTKENPSEAQFLGVFDILSWLNSKIENQNFYKVWRKRNLGA